jgi:hypothetical protein
MAEEKSPRKFVLRRSPKLSAFLLVSAVVGFFLTLGLTSLYQSDPAIGFAALFWYFSLFGMSGTLGLGVVLWLILDFRSKKKAQEVAMERDTQTESDA